MRGATLRYPAFAALVCAAVVAPAQASFPGENGRIAYERWASGVDHDIYSAEADGSGERRLTDDPGDDVDPAWSPDGTQIAYASSRDPDDPSTEIYVMNADGSGKTRLTTHSGYDAQPAWSPDGSRIAFSSYRLIPEAGLCDFRPAPCFRVEVYVMDADGSDVTRLPGAGGTRDWPPTPSWSPDGSLIAFEDDPYDPVWEDWFHDLHVVHPDGSGLRLLNGASEPAEGTFGPHGCGNPSPGPSVTGSWEGYLDWSPDGSRIVFIHQSDCDGDPYYDIDTANPDGTGVHRLTPDQHFGTYTSPVWAPDGTRIAFTLGFGFGVMAMDGEDWGSRHSIVSPGCCAGDPSWQPIVNHPPDCSSLTATPSLSLVHDRRLRVVMVAGATDPDGDAVEHTVTGVTQDEPPTGPGDPTAPDARLLSGDAVRVRAERAPRGDGRVYRIAVAVSDGEGGACTGTATVDVRRHKQRAAVDSAPPGWDSLAR